MGGIPPSAHNSLYSPLGTIKPVIQKNSVYGDRTTVQIRTGDLDEEGFCAEDTRQDFELPRPISRTHSEPGLSGSQRTEPRKIPIVGSSSEKESKQSPMKEDTSGRKSDKHADIVERSSTFISELMAHAAESMDIPRLLCDIKKTPVEDQQVWLKACDEEMESRADQKIWKLVDLPPSRKPVKC